MLSLKSAFKVSSNVRTGRFESRPRSRRFNCFDDYCWKAGKWPGAILEAFRRRQEPQASQFPLSLCWLRHLAPKATQCDPGHRHSRPALDTKGGIVNSSARDIKGWSLSLVGRLLFSSDPLSQRICRRSMTNPTKGAMRSFGAPNTPVHSATVGGRPPGRPSAASICDSRRFSNVPVSRHRQSHHNEIYRNRQQGSWESRLLMHLTTIGVAGCFFVGQRA